MTKKTHLENLKVTDYTRVKRKIGLKITSFLLESSSLDVGAGVYQFCWGCMSPSFASL